MLKVGLALTASALVLWVGCGGSEAGSVPAAADAGGSTTTDAASPADATPSSTTDGGPKGHRDPATVPGVAVTYGTCPSFAKCDGSIEGSWNVKGGCLPDDTFDQYKTLCPGFQESNVIIKASGTVVATATNLKRSTSIFVAATFVIPKLCVDALVQGNCKAIGPLLTSGAAGQKFDEATCTALDNGGCTCDAQATAEEATDDTYTTNGKGTLTSGANKRTFDYCPAGATVTYHETTKGNPTFGMLIDIGK